MEHPLTTPVAGQSAQIACQVEGTSLRLLEQGRERFEAILRLIDQAQTSVRLLFYIFSNDAAGVRVRDALLAAARRGVKVKLLIDGFGCSDLGPDFFAASTPPGRRQLPQGSRRRRPLQGPHGAHRQWYALHRSHR